MCVDDTILIMSDVLATVTIIQRKSSLQSPHILMEWTTVNVIGVYVFTLLVWTIKPLLRDITVLRNILHGSLPRADGDSTGRNRIATVVHVAQDVVQLRIVAAHQPSHLFFSPAFPTATPATANTILKNNPYLFCLPQSKALGHLCKLSPVHSYHSLSVNIR